MYLYRAFDHAGRLLYIGITSCIYVRLQAHRRTSSWYGDVQSWAVSDLSPRCSWGVAHDAEVVAIKTEDPLHNVVHNPRWRKAYRAGWVHVGAAG